MSRIGKIKTVCCKNFVTYSKCVFNPTEFLNVIVGPNGSGKSTLVSAIVLSLGGEPTLLGRSSSIADYVKNGCESATVYVEIYDNNDDIDCKTTIFLRLFNIHNKSQFYVNNQLMEKKSFLETVSRYNIQINNLCQFLPQDRVQDFAKIEPADIFINTISSVCKHEEIEHFQKLKRLRNEQKSGTASHKQLLKQLEETNHRVGELQIQLERFNVHKEIKEKLNVCNAKLLYSDVEKISCQVLELENDIKKAKATLKKDDKEFKSIINKRNVIDTTAEKFKKEMEEKDLHLKSMEIKKSQIIENIELLKQKIHEGKLKYLKHKRCWNDRQNEVNHETKMLEIYKQDLINLNKNKSADHLRKMEYETKINEYKCEIRRLYSSLRNTKGNLEETSSEIHNLETSRKNLENETEQKMQSIKSRFPDVYSAIDWIDKNMHLFKGRVYKPIVIEIKLRNLNHAKYLENTISQHDLLAFSCENESDMSILVAELCMKQNLLVNVFHAPPSDESIFTPKMKINHIQKYGFKSYLINEISGPPAILGYLCSSYNLQNIPFGDENVNNFTDQIPQNIRLYYGGDSRYELKISKYGNRSSSLMQSNIKGKGFLSCKDDNQIKYVEKRLSDLYQSRDLLRNERTAIEAEIRKHEVCHKKNYEILKEIKGTVLELEQKENLIKRQEDKIAKIQQEMIDIPKIEKELRETEIRHLKNILKYEKFKVEALEKLSKIMANKTYSKIKMSIFNQENEELSNFIQTATEKRETTEKQIQTLLSKCKFLKSDSKLKSQEARRLLNDLDPDNAVFPYKDFYNSLPNNIEDLKDSIRNLCGHLNCLDNLNPEIIREHDEKTNEVEDLRRRIEENEQDDKNCLKEIKSFYEKWYPKIFKIIADINSHFFDFMQSMGYVGEVKLVRKEEFDFDSYGIEILVQYRKNVALQPLSRNVQSGGERAVAIAVYTLSMQHITHVPFRCVDEINQGMDARNERKIFEMLVDETTKDDRAQYFFVTPKLLRNLKSHERMSVHVVYNGRMVQSQNVFDFQV